MSNNNDQQIKVIFLDRDGVLTDNSEHYYITAPSQLRLNPGVIEALSLLKNTGFRFIVITNQGGISQGVNTHESVARVHNKLRQLLAEGGIELDEIYYCPHHSDNENCLCRKPLPLLLEKAIARFNVDKENSWFIGDSERDVEAGKAAGVKTLQVEPNADLRKIVPEILE
jgi:D-glycero-D-manno-heptose 1,7-bisphosphate phosphatase